MSALVRLIVLAVAFAGVLALSAVADSAPASQSATTRIEHLVVIYLENWSFDGLYGSFPGADGLTPTPGTPTPRPQADKTGVPLPNLSPVSIQNPGCTVVAITTPLPNRPFDLSPIVPPQCGTISDVQHRFYNEQFQINGGQMDRFVVWDHEPEPSLSMSHYDMAGVALQPSLTLTPVIARWALQYTLADRWFHAAFGDSWLNHNWLVCACTPEWYGTGPPAGEIIIPTITPTTGLFATGDNGSTVLLPNGTGGSTWYIVDQPGVDPCPANLASPIPSPTPTATPRATPVGSCVPLQVLPTIGDRLSQAGLDWGWYHEDIEGVLPNFQNYAANTLGHAVHMRWIVGTPRPSPTSFPAFATATPTGAIVPSPTQKPSFLQALKTPGALAAVSFVRPSAAESEHPGVTELSPGESLVAATLVPAIMTSTPYRQNKVAIVITYDENGGRWDHVAPPNPLTPATTPGKADRFGPGSRIPAIIISPWAKRCFVDHTQYDTTSIAAFIEHNWRLAPLTSRDAAADPISNAFNFTATPLPAGACPGGASAAPATATPTRTPTTTPGALTAAQAIAQVRGTYGQTGQAGVPAASRVGDVVSVGGGVAGSGRVTSSMAWTLTAEVPAGVPAGTVAQAVLSTTVGLEAFACSPVGAGVPRVTCTGTTAGNVLQGSVVVVVFLPGATVMGTTTGAGVATGGGASAPSVPAPPLLPLLPPVPPPFALAPPLPPGLLPPAPPGAPAAEVPVIPEAENLLLLALGLATAGFLARPWRRR